MGKKKKETKLQQNPQIPDFTGQQFLRLVNNFYNLKDIPATFERMAVDADLCNYIAQNHNMVDKKFRVALTCICVNQPYWQYAQEMLNGVRTFFAPGHDVDVFVWSDMPINSIPGLTVIPTEPVEWPMPTLYRYALMLQEEERLKEYDYIFYCDVDMKFVNIVGDEIFGDGLTAALHPMYALSKEFWPPYEPNPRSTAYIPRPGHVITDEKGRPRFMPMYFAGGFQGGTSQAFIEAMKVMKRNIDVDFTNNYIAIWNDESHWNRYLFDHPATKVLTPSYIYPDSLINEYYIPKWGTNYMPKIVTITKPFTTTPEAGQEVREMLNKPR